MTVETDAGQAGGEQAPIVNIPAHVAGGDGPLTARDAMRSLVDWRRKNAAAPLEGDGKAESEKTSGAETATTQTESATVQAEADAAPPEGEPSGETESQAEPEAEKLPSIEPPRSWTKEARERFAALPRETQEYLAERETDRDREVRRSQNEAAETRKAVEAERAQVNMARQQYESALPVLLQNLHASSSSEFADIKTTDDVIRLASDDPTRYVRWNAHQQNMMAVQAELTAAQQRQRMEAAERLNAFIVRESERFAEKVPEVTDKATRDKLFAQGRDLMIDLGFTDDEIGQLSRGDANISIHDHRLHLLIRDGIKWRDAQAQAKQKVTQAKAVPQVQRPGAAPDKNAARVQELKTLENSIGNLSGMAAVRAAAKLTAERRRAG